MARSFSVAVPIGEISMDRGKGEAVFTISNIASRPVLGRLRLTPLGQTNESWLGLTGTSEPEFMPNETQTVRTRIAVPSKTAPGTYSFRLDVVNLVDPDDDYTEGPTVNFIVQAIPDETKPFPWSIIAVVVMFLLMTTAAVTWLLWSPLTAKFDAKLKPAPEGATELNVVFTDQSTGTIAKRQWKFGDEGKDVLPFESEAKFQDISHTYRRPGTYTPELTVIGSSGEQNTFIGKPITFERVRPPVANFLLLNRGNLLIEVDLNTANTREVMRLPIATEMRSVPGVLAPVSVPCVPHIQGIGVSMLANPQIFVASFTEFQNTGYRNFIYRIDRDEMTRLKPVPVVEKALSYNGNLACGPDGHFYLAMHDTAQIYRFDGTTGNPLSSDGNPPDIGTFAKLDQFDPLSLAFGPDKNLYVTGNSNGILKVDGQTGKSLGIFGKTGGNSYGALAFSRWGQLLATDRNSAVIRQFDATTGESLGDYPTFGELMTIGQDDRVYTFLGGGATPGSRSLLSISDPLTGKLEKTVTIDSPSFGNAISFNFIVVAPPGWTSPQP